MHGQEAEDVTILQRLGVLQQAANLLGHDFTAHTPAQSGTVSHCSQCNGQIVVAYDASDGHLYDTQEYATTPCTKERLAR